MFELIAAAFLFLSFQKGGEGCKAMKCQWRGNSLNKAVGFALCPKKTIGGPQSLDYLHFSFLYNLLRREGRFQTRLFLHFSGGAISAASQIQLSARASPSYKIIKGFGTKTNARFTATALRVCRLGQFNFVNLFVTYFQTDLKGKYFQTK